MGRGPAWSTAQVTQTASRRAAKRTGGPLDPPRDCGTQMPSPPKSSSVNEMSLSFKHLPWYRSSRPTFCGSPCPSFSGEKWQQNGSGLIGPGRGKVADAAVRKTLSKSTRRFREPLRESQTLRRGRTPNWRVGGRRMTARGRQPARSGHRGTCLIYDGRTATQRLALLGPRAVCPRISHAWIQLTLLVIQTARRRTRLSPVLSIECSETSSTCRCTGPAVFPGVGARFCAFPGKSGSKMAAGAVRSLGLV